MASTNTTLTIVNLRPTAVISSATNLSNLVEGDWLNLTAADSLDTESDLISLTYVWDTTPYPERSTAPSPSATRGACARHLFGQPDRHR